MKKEIIKPKRNEIYMAKLPVTSASVQYGKRPVFVIQNNTGNTHSPTTIVVPMTSQNKRPLPTHVTVNACGKLTRKSTLLCEQIMTIATDTLISKVGEIRERATLKEIDEALKCSLNLG